MNDSSHISKSKKRRQRQKRRRQLNNAEITPIDDDINDKVLKNIEAAYTVLSPCEVKVDNGINNKTNKPIKSRSLDDDDMVKIQEISDVCESEDKDKESQAIVSEASESEVEWEETAELPQDKSLHGFLSTTTLPLEGYYADQTTLISLEDEKNLRDFLESLNLVNGPVDSAKVAYDKAIPESLKQKKVKTRQELEQYFLPICQNPRYLDVISEEASERDSDLEEVNSITKNLRRGTPELDLPPKVPPRRNKGKNKVSSYFEIPAAAEPTSAILLDTKLVEESNTSEGFCYTSKADEPSNAEIVFVLESSSNGSTEDGDTLSNDSYTLEIDIDDCQSNNNENLINDSKINQNNLFLVNTNTEERSNNLEETNHKIGISLPVEKETNISFVTSTNIYPAEPFTSANQTMIESAIQSELTPPPTPENMSPKSGLYVENKLLIEKSESSSIITNETLPEKDIKMPLESKINISPTDEPCRSSSSDGSSSRASSLCTAKYIPSQSSITDVSELAKEEDEIKLQPLTLREICLKFLLKLPFGTEILQELAEVSKRIESFTNSLPPTVLPKLYRNQTQFVKNPSFDPNNISSELSVQKNTKKMPEVGENSKEMNIPITEENAEIKIGLKEKVKNDLLLQRNSFKKGEVAIDETEIYMEKQDLGKVLQNEHIPVERRIPIKQEWIANNQSKPTIISTETFIPISINNSQTTTEKEYTEKTILVENKLNVVEKSVNHFEHLKNGKTSEINKPIVKDWEGDISPKTKEICVSIIPPKRSNNKSKEVNIPIFKDWVGLPSETDSHLLAYLSPKQREELDKSKRVPREAEKLIDLHEKFMSRRHSHDETKKEVEDKILVTGFNKNITEVSPSNRLLTIIREESTTGNDDTNYLYFVDKEPRPSSTLPRRMHTDKARLKAKDLNEWLELARNKSMSESNLSNVPDYPENNLGYYLNEPSTASRHRRTSLPQELYERQMIYIQEKEREIQKQLEALEEEKRKINTELSSSKLFRPEDFVFSKKGDYAESKCRHASMPTVPTEIFRQQMYEEFLDKVAEREDRKQHKVIKVTSSKDLDSTTEKVKPREIIHPIHLEKEFMEKVKQKQAQGKLEKIKSLEKEGSVEKCKDPDEPVFMMDGEKVKEAKGLPKHLQEFVDITKLADSGDGEFVCRLFVFFVVSCCCVFCYILTQL